MIRQLIITTSLAILTMSGLADRGAYASFRGTASASANTFAVGTVDIAQSPASAFLTLGGMVPSETVTAPLSVTNSGTVQLRYALTSDVTNTDGKGLGSQLDLTIKSGVTACTNAGFGASGTVLYGPDGPLGTIGSSLDLIGTPSSYPNGGRVLASGASEVLCFQVKLPTTTGTAYQGATTTATFNFLAQQT